MSAGSLQQRKCRVVAVLLAASIALFSRSATADELTDALIRYAVRDYARAIEMLTPLADRGNAVAQLKLGIIYARGEGVAGDSVAALRWLAAAAEQGQSEAQFELGVAHRDGLGTPVDGKLAMYWFQRAANAGVPRACNAIGEMYLDHVDVPQDYAAALVWFLRGAQWDDADSLYNIGVRYLLGQGVIADKIEAYKWFDLAAAAGLGELRDRAVDLRQAIGERLTPMQVSKAKSAAQDWLRTHDAASVAPELLLPAARSAGDTARLRREWIE
jgi:TPR repeat protein